MSTPRIDVDLGKIRQNTQTVVRRLGAHGIGVTAVTKAASGHPAIARAMLDGGALALGDSRLGNVHRLRDAGIASPITMIRTPMLSQIDEVVQVCEVSYNTELVVIAALAVAALRNDIVHGIILMVEMGDRREGILPQDVGHIAKAVMDMPGVALKGIGANFACLSGVAPDAAQMQGLTALANEVEAQCGPYLETVSGGNSANLPLVFEGQATGRITDLRVGEAILLGVDPVSGDKIDGLHQDAFALVAEVIETDSKTAYHALGDRDGDLTPLRLVPDRGQGTRLILAIGHQDTNITGLSLPTGHSFVGATSDHLVLGTDTTAPMIGSEVRFQMTYDALMRAMAAPDITITLHGDRPARPAQPAQDPGSHLTLV